MNELLSNATSLITLRITAVTSFDTGLIIGYPNSANFSFTASCSTYEPPDLIQVMPLQLLIALHDFRNLQHACVTASS